jgi:hypothetical protein
MQRLTNNELDALEAAQRLDAGHTKWGRTYTSLQDVYSAYDALPALLEEVRELRRLTTPEPISEKHRDGNWWLLWEPGAEGWFKCRWRPAGDWQKSGTTEHLHGTPTHALPLPGRPDA